MSDFKKVSVLEEHDRVASGGTSNDEIGDALIDHMSDNPVTQNMMQQQSDVVDGKATRDLKKGEMFCIDIVELLKLATPMGAKCSHIDKIPFKKLWKMKQELKEDDYHIVTGELLITAVKGCYNESVLVSITQQHAYSLICLVRYFKGMIGSRNFKATPLRSDELTTAYCDELLEDLRNE
ncbi:MAG: hypothetical protein KAS32_22120 [Candidatus Peribacteraceae bacterium]|nr:hypothetical protein [Candidatus Peribacteraceae bacterium]